MSIHQHFSFHKGMLPREGFHADVLGGIIKRTLLNPTLLLPLIAAARYTVKGREAALSYPQTHYWAKVLAVFGSIRVINGWLSRRAVNNAVTDVYDWGDESKPSKELVLVSGGSDGIGKCITLMLASRNIRVVVLDIQPLTFTAPPTVTFHQCDITSTGSIDKVASELRTTIGEPTVLILNAGICRGKPMLENTDADLNATFAVNTISHYKLAREFLPNMVAHNHGMVVTVASSAAWVTAPRMTEYAASKAAAVSFHEGLAAELVTTYKAPKVRTVLVNQGYTQTSLFEGFGVKKDAFFGPALTTETVAQAIAEQVLKGESGQVILPGFYKMLAAHIRSLPDWMSYPMRLGLEKLMSDWKGRQVDQATETGPKGI